MATNRELSKKDWQSDNPMEGINSGSLQRIADATEKMAVNFVQLQNERDLYKRWYEGEKKSSQRMANRIRSLQGVITKLKKKL
jgi:hypothetical protein